MKIKIGDTLRIADCESMRYSSGGCRVGKVTEIDAILRRCLDDSDPDNDYVRFSWF